MRVPFTRKTTAPNFLEGVFPTLQLAREKTYVRKQYVSRIFRWFAICRELVKIDGGHYHMFSSWETLTCKSIERISI